MLDSESRATQKRDFKTYGPGYQTMTSLTRGTKQNYAENDSQHGLAASSTFDNNACVNCRTRPLASVNCGFNLGPDAGPRIDTGNARRSDCHDIASDGGVWAAKNREVRRLSTVRR